jgi:methionine-rich copper-binding protein CopC
VGNGITFVIQGDTPATVGASGGGMGYGPDTPSANRGIRNSVAVKFRSTNTTADPGNNTGLFTDGRSPSIPEAGSGNVNVPLDPAVINLSGPDPANPDPIQVDMTYDGTTLDVTIRDTVTGGMLSQSYTVNIPALVGGNAAYVGFTGGTGGVHSAFQVIQSWTFQPSIGGGGGGSGSGAGSGPAPRGRQGGSSGPSARSDPPAAPSIISQTPNGNNFGIVSVLQVGFDEPIDPSSFTLDQIVSFTRTIGSDVTNLLPMLIGVTPISSANQVFNISFVPQSALGVYTMVIGPHIQDTSGNEMDQDHDGPPFGEDGVAPAGDQYAANFNIVGPKITAQNVTGNNNLPGMVNSLEVTFNESMNPLTFVPSAITDFHGPDGTQIAITGVSPVSGSNNTRFNITFAQLTRTGHYTMIIGPNILDSFGNPMDQDGDFIPGEASDVYTALFGIAGLKVMSSTPTGNNNAPSATSFIQVTFNESVNPTTFTASQVVLTVSGVAVPITAITPVAGSNNTRFNLSPALVTTGMYHLVVGPDIQDTFGNEMDQDGNLIPGEVPEDQYMASFGILGPRITSPTSTINSSGPTFSVRVTFNEAMDVSTFTRDKIASFTGPNGASPLVTAIAPVGTNPLNTTQFDIMFAPQQATGIYTMVIGPDIRDLFGNEMDQDNNLVPGEVPQDQFTLRFTVPGPRITSTSSLGNHVAGFNDLQVTFNEPMQPGTFSPAKIASFIDPMGNPVTVTGVAVVPSTNNMTFDIQFNPAGRVGTYTMVIGPNILDLYGNQIDQNGNFVPGEVPGDQFRLTFNITGPMVVSASPSGGVHPPVDHVRLTYNEPMNPDTLTAALVTFTGPDGSTIDVTDVQPVAGSNNTQFDVSFDAQTTLGAYTMVIAARVMDTFGNSAPEFTDHFSLANERILEDFESGNLSRYSGSTSDWVVTAVAAHDGALGLSTRDSSGEWIYRNDADAHVAQGDVISAWAQMNGSAGGRVYLGFGASSSGTLSMVLAPNTGTLVIQENNFFNFLEIAAVNQTFLANHWYRMEVTWQVGGNIIGRLYDSDGTTLLNTVTAHSTLFTQGGIAFRGLSSNVYFDTVTAIPGAGGGPGGGRSRSAASAGLAGGNYVLPPITDDQNPELAPLAKGADVVRALAGAYANLLSLGSSTSPDAGSGLAAPIPAPFDGSNTDLFPAPTDAKALGKQQLAVALALAGDLYDPLTDLGGLDVLAQLKHLNGKR